MTQYAKVVAQIVGLATLLIGVTLSCSSIGSAVPTPNELWSRAQDECEKHQPIEVCLTAVDLAKQYCGK